MDWMDIVAAIALGMMAVFIFPRMKHMLKESPEGDSSDWMSALIPIALVGGFVVLLIAMV